MILKRLKCLLMKKLLRLNKQSTKQKEERIFSPLFVCSRMATTRGIFLLSDKNLKSEDGADLVAAALTVGAQTVTAVKG